ncbi:MAG: acyl-CoA/acyl-ACP dehydrogenase [Actinomycetota bacterium]|jgi:alkylation response protein AidB-like acyl-CoA dehydrogenase|nr:acyl-CoA/acyl-ACP dehydrogenase [Actinomycetota bacterium]
MDLEFTSEQEELRSSVRAFLAAECPIDLVRQVVEDTIVGAAPSESGSPAAAAPAASAAPPVGALGGGCASSLTGRAGELWQAMVALDWPALNVPEECGGMGLGMAEVALVVEELGAVVAPGPFLATATQFVPAVVAAGTADQRRRLLAPIASGERTGALAVADHPGRWSGGVSATAERTSAGWVLRGVKHMVCAGPQDPSDVVVVARPTTSEPGIGMFVVPLHRLDVHSERVLDPSRPLSRVVVDGVEVPDGDVLGDPGAPTLAAALDRVMAEAALGFAVEIVGTCRSLLDMTIEHAKNRRQFGVPIGSFQAVKHKMADLYVALERARSLAYYAIAAIDEHDPQAPLAVAMAKAAADDCQRVVCRESIQTFGGIGFTWEADVHLFAKRAMSAGALFGSAREHRLTIARLLGACA